MQLITRLVITNLTISFSLEYKNAFHFFSILLFYVLYCIKVMRQTWWNGGVLFIGV